MLDLSPSDQARYEEIRKSHTEHKPVMVRIVKTTQVKESVRRD